MQRQYTGTAGKITNCQLGVFLAYAGPKGRALVDRELYLPRSWAGDEARLAAAGVPDGTAFRTKPQLLRLMIERAAAAGIPFRWVTADEAYGDNGPLREFLEEKGIAYVPAVARDHLVATPTGPRRADILAAAGTWHRASGGNGAKGRRWYDWALFATTRPQICLLVRRSVTRPSELAFYLCHTPQPAPLAVLVKVAATRWCVEECFPGRQERGRPRPLPGPPLQGLVRYVTLAMLALAMLALAWLAVTRAELAEPGQPGETDTSLTTSANEIRRLFTALCGPPADEKYTRRWSRWRHRHQEHARRCHYRRQRQQDH